jgi:YebC/PmpR family DNA-binding regulatory protein
MSGHSKWASIKHKKAATDSRRGRLFTKLIREISIAARMGGGDPDANPRLRTAVAAAKSENMPGENIKRAIQKGTGELPGAAFEEAFFEGYGPGGVALMLEVTTDNRNRTLSGIRHLLSRYGGSLGENGCVSWMFNKKSYLVIPRQGTDEEKLLSTVLDAGAEDLTDDGSNWEIYSPPKNHSQVLEAVKSGSFTVEAAEVSMIPQSQVKLAGKPAQQMLKLVEELEDHEDVQHVYANFDIDESEMHALAGVD